MSKLNCIDKKRRFNSFLLYIFVAACFMAGCATKSSVGITPAADADSQSGIDQSTDYSGNDTAQEKAAVTKSTDNGTEVKTVESIADKKDIEEDYTESEPRIFIKPSGSKLGQILGIDFSMIPQGKSRLTITTNKKISYDLDRINSNTFDLNIRDSKIGNDILLRYIDTTEFQTAVEKINPAFDKDNNKVSLGITMREIVPYYIEQSDNILTVDFDRIKTKIPEKNIVPLNLTEAETKNLAASTVQASQSKPSISQTGTQSEIQAFSSSAGKKYKGEKLDLEFAKAVDVAMILRLINEISDENIIWDPAVEGKKVSMILKNVSWDEALDLIMKNNDLAKRYMGENIIWITTKQRMAQILAEEESEARKMEQKLEEERQKLVDQAKRVEDESPLITEYLPVDFAEADKIKEHIIVSKRGSVRIDSRTNFIIITDTEASIEEAKKIVKQFDTPVKQIMIEARIVEATDDFTRDLGIKWNGGSEVSRSVETDNALSPNTDILTVESDGTIADRMDLSTGRGYGGSFSTNSPASNWGNIGLNFAKISAGGANYFALDATLALAETTGKAKTLSAPKVIAQEGSEAKISAGEIIKIAATENVESEDFPAELSLSVTPSSVSFNNYITLTVDVSDDQRVTDTRKTTKTISTTLMVKSGETVVIGGIIKEKESEDVTGIPVLKDIPGLGWLFKGKRKQVGKSELLIFLTPNVIPSPVKSF